MKKLMLFLTALTLMNMPIRAAFIGNTAPAFTLKSLSGAEKSLKDYQGQVVFVNFWASWCPPCKQEFPELNELANEYKSNGLAVLAINVDKSADRVQSFLEKMKVTPDAIQILLDPQAKVVASYVARSMPSSFIIDQKGVIQFVHFGYSEKDPAKWRAEIDQLLKVGKK